MIKYIKIFIVLAFITVSQTYAQVVRFAAIGDYGGFLENGGAGELAVANMVKSWDTDTSFFIITLGDNNYFPTVEGYATIDYNIGQFYHQYIYPYNPSGFSPGYGPNPQTVNRFFPALGNHDHYGNAFYAHYNYFVFNNVNIGNSGAYPGGRRYFDFQKGNTHFFCLNTGTDPQNHTGFDFWSEPDGIDSNSIQGQWLKSRMLQSTAKWKIVYLHHPPYYSIHGFPSDGYAVLRYPFKRWGADVVLSGHLHTYEKLYVNGLTYIINGLGGDSFGNDSLYTPPYPGSLVRYSANYGAMKCETYNDSMVFRFININNNVIDYARITKNGLGPLPSKIYVNDNSLTGNIYTTAAGNNLNSGSAGSPFATIAHALLVAGEGDTIMVDAGNYPENIDIDKSVTILGTNKGIEGYSGRVSESNIITSGNQNAVITISADSVCIDGFTINGNDPLVTGSSNAAGNDVNAAYGILSQGSYKNLTIRNNIIKNVFTGFKGDGLSDGNHIIGNLFNSIGKFNNGSAVALTSDYYSDVLNNKMTKVWAGIKLDNHHSAGGPLTWTVSGNEIHSYAAGFIYFDQKQNATPVTFSNNKIFSDSGAVTDNLGMLLVSVKDSLNPVFADNIITGTEYGIVVSNVPGINHLSIAGSDTITGTTKAGILFTNNLNFNPVDTAVYSPPDSATVSVLKLGGIYITANSGTGIILDALDSAITELNIFSQIHISGGATGLLITGASASVTGNSISNLIFSGQNDKYISLSNNALSNFVIDATGTSFDGNTGSDKNIIQNFYTEDRIDHKIDDSLLGFILVKAGNDFVTSNSFISPNTTSPSVQRCISSASAGFTVNVGKGIYAEDIEINKRLNVSGDSPDSVIIKGLYSGNPNTVLISSDSVSLKNITVTRDYGTDLVSWQASSKSNGILFGSGTSDVHIDNLIVTGNRTGIYISNSQNATITNCLIDSNYAGVVFSNNVNGISLNNCFIQNNFTNGVLFDFDAGVLTAENAGIINNSISGNWYSQINFKRDTGPESNAGNLSGLNMNCNWYGSVTPSVTLTSAGEPDYAMLVPTQFGGADPELNHSLYGIEASRIPFTPWLVSGTDADTSSAGFQQTDSCMGYPQLHKFYVNDNSQTGDIFTTTTGSDNNRGDATAPFATLSRALSLAVTGDTIFIDAGTYTENDSINIPVLISGAGQGLTFLIPGISKPVCEGNETLCDSSSNVLMIRSDSITIKNLTIDGNNPSLISGVITGSADIDARNGINTDTASGELSSIIIDSVTVKNVYFRGLVVANSESYLFTNSSFENIQGDTNSAAIFNTGSSGVISNNNFSNTAGAIVSYYSKGTVYNNNINSSGNAIVSYFSKGTVYNNNAIALSGKGIVTVKNSNEENASDTIRNNNITNSASNGYGIIVDRSSGSVLVKENTITNTDNAIVNTGQSDSVTSFFLRNIIDGQNKAGSTGITQTTHNFIDSSLSVSGVYLNNFVQNNTTGFNIVCEADRTNSITANDNFVSGNTTIIDLTSAGTLNNSFTCNWWGTASSGDVSASINSSVNYIPFLRDGSDNESGLAGFQPLPGTCTGYLSKLYVNDGSQTGDFYTTAIGSDSNSGTQSSPFATVTHAVSLANAGDSIFLDAGTFNEDIELNKKIKITGTSSTLTIIKGLYSGNQNTVLISSDSVSLKNITVTRDYGIDLASWQGSSKSSGILVGQNTTGIKIENSVITGNRNGISLSNSQNANITNCLIDSNYAGVVFSNNVNGTSLKNCFIQNNFTNGILFDFDAGVLTAENAGIINNSIRGNWYSQINFKRDTGPESNTGSLSGLNMNCNWYGSVTPSVTLTSAGEPEYAALTPAQFGGVDPGLNHSLYGIEASRITFTPWLISGADADTNNIGFQQTDSCNGYPQLHKFYVNDNSQVGDIFTTAIGSDNNRGDATAPFATLSRALTLAVPGDTIYIDAGAYTENDSINNPVLISGAGQGLTFLIPGISKPVCEGNETLCDSSSNVLMIRSDSITIKNLTIDGNNPSLTSGVITGSIDIDARNGIITDTASGEMSSIIIDSVTVKNVYFRGLSATTGGSLSITNSTFENIQGDTNSAAVLNYGSQGVVSNNSFSNTSGAIVSYFSKGTVCNNNNITQSGKGILIVNNTDEGNISDTIRNNSISNSALNGFGIIVEGSSGSVAVKENTITNTDNAIVNSGQSDSVTAFFISNIIDGQNKSGSTGITQTTGMGIDSSSSVSGIYLNNFVQNNTTGFNIVCEADLTNSITANDNFVSGNASIIDLTSAGTLNNGFSCNWWGTASSGDVSAAINSAVNYIPFLRDGTDNESGLAGFQPLPGTCTGYLSKLYVNDGSQTGDFYTTAIGSDSNSGTQSSPFATVTHAVSLANAGDTIYLDAGTFSEDIELNKKININGASPSLSIIKGLYTGNPNTLLISSDSVSLKNITVTRDYGADLASWQASSKTNGINIGQNITGIKIENAVITGNRNGILLNNSQNASITGCIIDSNYAGVVFSNNVNGTWLKNCFIQNNFTNGILFDFDAGVLTAENAGIINNSISGNWYSQINFKRDTGPESNAGNLSGLNMNCNWYGSVTPSVTLTSAGEPDYSMLIPTQFGGTDPGLNRSLYGIEASRITFTPWLISGTDADTSSAGFQQTDSCMGYPQLHKFFVNDNSQTGDIFTTASGSDNNRGDATAPFATLSHALILAIPGDTIYIDAGTYTENDSINNPVLISGAGQGLTFLIPGTSNPICEGNETLCDSSSNVLMIRSDSITIKNLTIDGNNPSLTSGVMTGSIDIDARNGIITDTASGELSSFIIDSVTVKNVYFRGLEINNAGSFVTTNCTFENIQGDTTSAALFNHGSSGVISYNIFSNTYGAVVSNFSKGTVYNNNSITLSGNGLSINKNGAEGAASDTVRNNTITNSIPNGKGIVISAPYRSVVIKENTITNTDNAIVNAGQSDSVTSFFLSNIIDGQNKSGSTGITQTTHGSNDSISSVSGVYLNNFIQNNTTGFNIVCEADHTNSITANDNFVSGNTTIIDLTSAGTLNNSFSCNWWGIASSGDVSASINSSVNYIPFLRDGSDNESGLAGFQPVPGTCTGYNSKLYVNDGSQTGDIYTTAIGSDSNSGTQSSPFATVTHAVSMANAGDSIFLDAGTFSEDIELNKRLNITGASSTLTIIKGLYSGNQNTVLISSDSVSLKNITVTRDYGTDLASWQAGSKTNGISFGQNTTGIKIENAVITGNRNGILLNNSQNASITNCLIDSNYAGVVFSNSVNGTVLSNCFIQNNFTHGILFDFDAGVLTAENAGIINNSISGNWYSQINFKRDTGPESNAGNLSGLNMNCNWYGSVTPSVTLTSAGEPDYAALTPAQFGGADPGLNHSLYGIEASRITFTPWLISGADADTNNIGFQQTDSCNGYPQLHKFYVNDSSQTGDIFTTATGSDNNRGDASAPFATLSRALSMAVQGDTIYIDAGTYNEDVEINKSLSITGATDQTIIKGLYSGNDATVLISSDSILIEDLTITRDFGADLSSWQNCMKDKGVSLAEGTKDIRIKNVKVTGNKKGIYINNSQNFSLKDCVIEDNYTGLQFEKNVRGAEIHNNFIRNNYTNGVLFNFDRGARLISTNVQVNNNNISGNWHSQVNFQHNNELIPTGDHNGLSFGCNWYGTAIPSSQGINDEFPDYSLTVPAMFGGTDPGFNKQLCGLEISISSYVPWITNGNDNDTVTSGYQEIPESCNGQLTAYYVNDSSTNGDTYTSNAGNDVNSGTSSAPFSSISHALTIADPGDTIYVDAGNYPESVNINKRIFIFGSNENISPNSGVRIPESVMTGANSFTASVPEKIIIKGFRFVTDSGYTFNTVIPGTDILFEKNILDGCMGLNFQEPDSLFLTDNNFKDIDSSSESAVTINGNFNGETGTIVQISNNIWRNCYSNGLKMKNVSGSVNNNDLNFIYDYGIIIDSIFNLNINKNIFNGIIKHDEISLTAGAGILVNTAASGSVTYINENYFTNNYLGMVVKSNDNPAGNNISVNNNSFIENTNDNIKNLSIGIVTASCNWYGTSDVIFIASKLSNTINFYPYLTDGTDAEESIRGFQPVDSSCNGYQTRLYVNDNTTIIRVFTSAEGNDLNSGTSSAPFASIRHAVSKANPNDTIYVDAGTYTLNDTINKPLTFIGAGKELTILYPLTSNPDPAGSGNEALYPDASNIILIKSENVRIKNLTIDGDNPMLNSGVLRNGADIDARNGIITDSNSGIINNLIVDSVLVKNIFLKGISAITGGTFKFSHNIADNIQGNMMSTAISNTGGSGSVINNMISNSSIAVSSVRSSGSVYYNNAITLSGTGIQTVLNGEGTGIADTIRNNTISNSNAEGKGIMIYSPYKSAVIRENIILNVDEGITNTGQSENCIPLFTGNYIDGQNRTGSRGVVQSIKRPGMDNSAVYGIFENNFIKNNGSGLYVECDSVSVNNITVHANNISGNIKGVELVNNNLLVNDFGCNWWGTAAQVDTAVYAGVSYIPFLTDSSDAELDSAGFQPVTGSCNGYLPSVINIRLIPEGLYNTETKNLTIRDTVKAYLHSNVSPFVPVDSAVSVIDSVTFTGAFTFPDAPSGTYYIEIRHRNSISTWSKAGGELFVPNSTMNYDFTDLSNKAFGNNLKQVDTSPVLFAVFGGDINQEGIIDLTDVILIQNNVTNFIEGYVITDVNGDNITDLNDVIISYNNSTNFVISKAP